MKRNFTREEVIQIIEDLLERGDVLIDCITSEDPLYTAKELLEMAEESLEL